jgi:hypothetical protein
MRVTSLVVTAALLLVATAAAAQGFGAGPASYLRVEAHTTATRHGQPSVEGYVYNERTWAAARILLLIEQLDDAGGIVSSRPAWVTGGLVPFGRAYFEAPVPVADGKYRVSVASVDWLRCGD